MKKLLKNRLLITGVLVSAFIIVASLYGFTSRQTDSEKLLGFTFNYDKKEVTINVVSTGCTVKKDFLFKVSNNTITITRTKKDFCKAMPQLASFTYSFRETGLNSDKAYTIQNKFIANLNLANIP